MLRNPPYGQPRERVVDALLDFLRRENMHGIGIDVHLTAVALLRCRPSGSVSFGDAVIAATALSAGITEAYSFDARFGRSGLRLVPILASADGSA